MKEGILNGENGRDGEKMFCVNVNRLEVIDHTVTAKDNGTGFQGGRMWGKWDDLPFRVQFELQDDEKTLKLFLVSK